MAQKAIICYYSTLFFSYNQFLKSILTLKKEKFLDSKGLFGIIVMLFYIKSVKEVY